MTTSESAMNQDPSLFCAYFGGPRDGLKTGDLPAALSGRPLTGVVSKLPLGQPSEFSLFAVYLCTSETQVDGFWVFEFQRLEGPNGEQLLATREVRVDPHETLMPDVIQSGMGGNALPGDEGGTA